MALTNPLPVEVPATPVELVIDALLAALELRHLETAEHARRVADLAVVLALAVDADLACEPDIRHGYLLHDIGKLGVPDAILLKAEPLCALERGMIERHPSLGEELVCRLGLPARVREVVACHHERWDGSGYPRRLAGAAIPRPARIFAVVDAFDAMTHPRPYRDRLSSAAALGEIEAGAGSQFDPLVVDAFLGLSALTTDAAGPSAGHENCGHARSAGIAGALSELATPRGAHAMRRRRNGGAAAVRRLP